MKSLLSEEAVITFKEGFSCSQAILLNYGRQFGLDETTAKKIARSFGGGMARTCQTCGAVTGAYMVIGLAIDNQDEKLAKESTYALVKEFDRRFKDLHGDVNCQGLLGCDLGTIDGQDYFKSNNLIDKCTGFVRDAGRIVEDLIMK